MCKLYTKLLHCPTLRALIHNKFSIFTDFLLDTTIQDGSKGERSDWGIKLLSCYNSLSKSKIIKMKSKKIKE